MSRGRGWRVTLGALVVALLAVPLSPTAAVQPTPHDRLVSPNPVDFTPHVVDGHVNAFAQVGSRIIAGGLFTRVRNDGSAAIITRSNIFAFDATTGKIDTSFTASTDGEVYSIVPAADGVSVYVAGGFGAVNGANRTRRVARISAANGSVIPTFQSPGINGIVKDISLQGDRLYVGGTFSTVGAATRPGLAAINATTGVVDEALNLTFGSPRAGGVTQVLKFDVTPDGSKLIAIGNFQTVGGQPRSQIVVVDLTTTPARLHGWSTNRYAPACSSLFDTYMRDIDIAPDGSYFVVVTTGAYTGGLNAGVLCDTASRWEIGPTGPNQQPAWVDYTGGDSLYSVAITGPAVYVGGHQRWLNNPFAGDAAGPGAVPRSGIAALDPLNGLPLSWDPGRDRGVGVFGLLGTSQGLWVGSDTDRIANEYHAKLALMPLAGGAVIPPSFTGSLPGDVFLLGKPANPVLYRVNAGGPALASTDGGPVWAADTAAAPSPRHNAGSSVATWSTSVGRHSSVPASTPQGVFSTERWDGTALPEMLWDFPVPAGVPVQVRLYFANSWTGTAAVGLRRFNVAIDGRGVLSRYDIVADVGNRVGTMKAFHVTSDGNVDIDFGHVTQNPLVNAIEIVRTDPQVLYRVNAGGPALASTDGGPAWAADTAAAPSPRHNAGSSVATWTTSVGRHSSVPASTPQGVFSTERWDGPALPAMLWDFPVPAGVPVQVRLYFANSWTGTAAVGQRRYNVAIDGRGVLSRYDIVADVGNRVGTMKAFNVTSDGNVDVDFGHVTQNPLVNAIEIMRTDLPAGAGTNDVIRREFTGTSVTSSTAVAGGGQPWREVRGAFMVNNTLFTGWSNGQMYARAFDGTTVGPAQQLNLYNLTAFSTELRGITGMFFDNGRLYFTRAGHSHLYARYFTPESRVVGAQLFDLGSVGGIDWAKVSGMFQVGDRLYFGSSADGNLRSVGWVNGTTAGTAAVVGGAGTDWPARGAFVDASPGA